MNWDAIEEVGFGPLALRPVQLYELTLSEFNSLVDGYKWREERHREKLAVLATWITAPHMKRPYKIDKLLGRKKEKKKTNKEETASILDELIKDLS